MTRSSRLIALLSFVGASTLMAFPTSTLPKRGFRHIPAAQESLKTEETASLEPPRDSAKLRVRSVEEIVNSLGRPDFKPTLVNKTLGPWIFSGYRNIQRKRPDLSLHTWFEGMEVLTNDSVREAMTEIIDDSLIGQDMEQLPSPTPAPDTTPEKEDEVIWIFEEVKPEVDILAADVTPRWLRNALTANRIQEDFMYKTMVYEPNTINFAYWDLPVPPRLPEDDVSFAAYIRKLDLPDVETDKAILPDRVVKRIHWLHGFNASMQFSQAYVSSNWYQGGNNHLSLLFNVNWNVQLNQVYHPNTLFQSNLQYKLGLYSTPQDEVHDYGISEDVLQYNLNAGLKAFKKWYYSFNLQFKTQIFKNYENNSWNRKASFLSPGDLNLGLGMSYTTSKPKWQLTATISPLSYNLKTCITDKMNHEQFNIKPDRKSHSEFGSNGEVVFTAKLAWNIDYRTRLFLFTDYSYFLGDWEHTINFNFNKFLTTQLYVHLREDTSTDTNTKWKHFMMREVLSFGLTYTFSTKP